VTIEITNPHEDDYKNKWEKENLEKEAVFRQIEIQFQAGSYVANRWYD
jgi:hypothetical protein